MKFILLFLFCFPSFADQNFTYIRGPSLINSTQTTATAGSTTTLTAAFSTNQQFTGSSNQTIVLPDATTLDIGRYFYISNRSSGVLTVNYNGGTLSQTMVAGTQAMFIVESKSTSTGVWDISYVSGPATQGNLTDAGTDGIIVGNGTGAVFGSGTTLAQHVADTSHNGYLLSTDWNTFNGKQAALTIGNLTDVGTDGIVVTNGVGSVIGTGTSLAQHVADTTHSGYLSSTDWNTFNGKQASGSYITALTGDVTASGPGSATATLATVNTNTGSFGSSSSIPSITVNGKGLITAASGNAVVAPAGTLTGTTLASNVVTSSLTTVGTIATGVWNGTAVVPQFGGTGLASLTAYAVLAGGTTSTGTLQQVSGVGTSAQVLTSNGAAALPTWQAAPSANSSTAMYNLGISTSVGSSNLTINLKQSDGATDPSTGAAAVIVGIHGTTAGTASYNLRSVTGALSFVINSGTTLGFVSTLPYNLYFYLIDSDGSGTMKLGASLGRLDDGQLYSTVKESFSATATNASPSVFTSNGHGLVNGQAIQITGTPPTGFSTATTYYVVAKATNTFELALNPGGTAINSSSTGSSIVIHMADGSLVSDGVYATVAIRLIGYGSFTEATSGTWATNAATLMAGTPRAPSYMWQGYHGNDSNFGLTSATIADFGTDSSSTFTRLMSVNMPIITSQNSGTINTNNAGIIISPPVPGSWHICGFTVLSNTVNEAQTLQLADGSNNEISTTAQVGDTLATNRIVQPLCGDYSLAAWPAAFIIKFRGAAPSGTLSLAASGNIGRSINWSIHWNGY